MREFFDAIDRTDPLVLIAGALASLLALLSALEWALRRRRYELAQEFLQGYAAGYLDGHDGKLPIVQLQKRLARFGAEIPEAFHRAMRR